MTVGCCSPVLAGFVPLVRCRLRPDNMSNANVYRLMGWHSHLVRNNRLGHHRTVMAAVWPHFPLTKKTTTHFSSLKCSRGHVSTWYLKRGSFLIFLPPVSSPLRSNDCIWCQARSRWWDLLPSWHQDLWSSVGPRLLKGQKRTMLNLCNVYGFEFNIETGTSRLRTTLGHSFSIIFPHYLVK